MSNKKITVEIDVDSKEAENKIEKLGKKTGDIEGAAKKGAVGIKNFVGGISSGLSNMLKASGILLLIDFVIRGISQIVEAFKQNEAAADFFRGLFAYVEGAISFIRDGIVKVFQNLQKVGDFFKGDLLENIKNLGKYIINTMLDPFMKIYRFISGIAAGLKDMKNFGEAFNTEMNKTSSVFSDVSSLQQDVIQGVKDMAKGMDEAGKAAKAYSDIMDDIEDNQVIMERNQKKTNAAIAEAKEISSDINNSYEKRIAALKLAASLEQQNTREQLALKQQEANAVKDRLKTLTQDQSLINKQYEVETQIFELKQKQSKIQKTLGKEIRTLTEKEIDDQNKLNNIIDRQIGAKKSAIEEEKIAVREKYDKELLLIEETAKKLGVNEEELSKLRIKSADDLSKELINIDNKQKAEQVQAHNDFLNTLYKDNLANQDKQNKSKIDGFLKNSKTEQDFLNNISKIRQEQQSTQMNAEIEARKAMMDQQLITEEEFNAEKALIEQKYKDEKTQKEEEDKIIYNENRKKQLEEEKADKMKQLEEISTLSNSLTSSITDFNIMQKQKEIDRAGNDKAKIEAINKKYAKKQQMIDIAQAVINGALGIVKTGSQMGYPMAIPFQIIQGIQTAIQIGVIKSQKFAKGVIDFRAQGTDIYPAMLSPGESVLTASATSKYLPEITEMSRGTFKNEQVDVVSIVSEIFKQQQKQEVFLSLSNLNLENKRYVDIQTKNKL
jgi:hypothetical protein